MKYFIILIFVAIAANSHAQIKLEQTYRSMNKIDSATNEHREFGLLEVDSAVFRYVDYNSHDSIYIYNLDHSLDRIIIVPNQGKATYLHIAHISKRLYDTDDAYEYLLTGRAPSYFLKVFKENGELLFACSDCDLYTAQNYINDASEDIKAITNTPTGAKMLVEYYDQSAYPIAVFGLQGKLPHSKTSLSVNEPAGMAGISSLPTSAFPNPSSGPMHISYTLPEGVATGEIVLTDISGKEVKRYRIGNIFHEILIEPSELQSGSYFYKVVSAKGESDIQKIIMRK